MALTITPRGASFYTGSPLTNVLCLPTSTFAEGSLAVLLVAYDNSGTVGADPYTDIGTAGVDLLGNLWTSRQNALQDPGAASAGATFRIFTARMDSPIDASSGPTVSFSADTTARAYAFWEVKGSATGIGAFYLTGATSVGAGTAFTMTTGSVAVADGLICGIAVEDTSSGASDADTTNGTWSTAQATNTTGGGGAANMGIRTQYKIQTTTPSTQTWNFTIANTDRAAAWITVREGSGTKSFTAGAVIKANVTGYTVPVLVGSTSASTASNANISGTIPSETEPGDELLAVVATPTGTHTFGTAPGGWSERISNSASGGIMGNWVLTKTAAAGDAGAAVAFNGTTAIAQLAGVFAYRKPGTTFETIGGTGVDTDNSVPLAGTASTAAFGVVHEILSKENTEATTVAPSAYKDAEKTGNGLSITIVSFPVRSSDGGILGTASWTTAADSAVIDARWGWSTGGLSANAVFKKTISGSFTANASIAINVPGSRTANAVIKKTVTSSGAQTYLGAANANTIVAGGGWTNPTNAYGIADDTLVASASNAGTQRVTDYGFADITSASIPDGSTIDEVRIHVTVIITDSGDAAVQGTINGSAVGSPTTSGGGDVDWVFPSTPSLADLRDASSVVGARLLGPGSFGDSAEVDHVRLEVDFFGGGGGPSADAVIVAAGGGTISGSRTANAVIGKTLSGSLTANAVFKKTGIASSLTANADIKRTQTGSLTANAVLKRTIAGSLTANAFIPGRFTANAVIVVAAGTVTGSFTGDATTALVGVPIWISPLDGAPITTTPTLVFTVPTATGKLWFNIHLDRVSTFDSVDLRDLSTVFDVTGWDYWNGSSWLPIPAGGLSAGPTQARYTVSAPLSSGTWYRRVRAGTTR
jgi:hypothetical protein